MPTLPDVIKNNPVVFFLGTLITGFLAGIGAYQDILEIAQIEFVHAEQACRLPQVCVFAEHICLPPEQCMASKPRSLTMTLLRGKNNAVLPFNIAVKLDETNEPEGNYDPQERTVKVHFYYPAIADVTVNAASTDDDPDIRHLSHKFPVEESIPLSLDAAGFLKFMVDDPKFSAPPRQVESVRLTIVHPAD